MVKHETELHSQKNDCHANVAEFGNDQYSLSIGEKREDIIYKQVDLFSSESVKPFQNHYEKPITEILQQYYNNLHF